MPAPRRRFVAPAAEVRAGLARIREAQAVPATFPAAVQAEAEAVARRGPVAPGTGRDATRRDLRELPFVTIDPSGSRDLDQALHLSRSGDGYRLRYAIADVACFVAPGGAIDAEARRRGVTLYAPDERAPLHPAVLSEGVASLLPGDDRPAVVWDVDLDAAGVVTATRLERAWIRSRAALAYPEVQAVAERASPHVDEPGDNPATHLGDMVGLLREVGIRRLASEAARGGVSLGLAEQEISGGDGGFALTFRRSLPVERWNAQLSLACGMQAAVLMGRGGLGLLRTVPAADPAALERLRRSAEALGVAWPATQSYAEWVTALDGDDPRQAALLEQAARTLRGAGYTVVRTAPGTAADALPRHAAVAAPYAHVTAPLRRLADRFATELALAAHDDTPPPAWVVEALDDLPKLMGAASQRASALDRAVVDLVEAVVLRPHVGDTFAAAVVDVDDRGSRLQLVDPAVVTTIAERLPLGARVRVRLDATDVAAGRVVFSPSR